MRSASKNLILQWTLLALMWLLLAGRVIEQIVHYGSDVIFLTELAFAAWLGGVVTSEIVRRAYVRRKLANLETV